MTNAGSAFDDADEFLRSVLIEQVLGGGEGYDRLVELAFAGDRVGLDAMLDLFPHHVLVDFVAKLLVFSTTAAHGAAQQATEHFHEALIDIRDHGGSLEGVIAAFAVTLKGHSRG